MPSREDDMVVRINNDQTRKTQKGGRRKPATKVQTRRARVRRERAREMYAEAMRFAEQLDITLAPNEPVTDIIVKIINRTHALWRHAASKVDELDPDAKAGTPESIFTYKFDEHGNKLVEPSKWVAFEQSLRQELYEQVALAQKLRIDEAAVRVEAAKLDLLSQALKQAVRKAGVPEDMQRKIGAALRDELKVIEGNADQTDEHPSDSEQAA